MICWTALYSCFYLMDFEFEPDFYGSDPLLALIISFIIFTGKKQDRNHNLYFVFNFSFPYSFKFYSGGKSNDDMGRPSETGLI